MTDLKTPSQHDFHAYAELVGKQGDHFETLCKWGGHQCREAGDLNGLLYPAQDAAAVASEFFTDKLAQCQRGMRLTVDKVNQTSTEYARTDQGIAQKLRGIYPEPLPGFPDLGAMPGLPRIGNFTDESISLKEPTSADDDTSKDIHHQFLLRRVLSFREKFKSGELAIADKIFQFCTGQDLVKLLLDPLLGNYGRLLYLHDAYSQLSDATYTVAATLRKGSWALADEWVGEGATAFDSYMFRWTMGIGGIGDAAAKAAGVYKVGYDTAVALASAALNKINDLMDDEIAKLAEQAGETVAGDATIEAVGLGPEDPVADVAAGAYTGYKMYKIYKIVKRIVSAICIIEKIFHDISEAVATIERDIHAITQFVNSPLSLPSVGSLINDVEQRGFRFEQNGSWNATLGASRIALLPSA